MALHEVLEEHLSELCPCCGREHHARFFSLFLEDMHYIIGDCVHCGYQISIRRDDLGMGLFDPAGNVTTVTQDFSRESVEHMRSLLEERGEARFVGETHARSRMRLLK